MSRILGPTIVSLRVALVCSLFCAIATQAEAARDQIQPQPAGSVADSQAKPWLELLASGSDDEREQAVFKLAESAPPEALPALIRALREDSSPAVREAAAFALGAYHPPSDEAVRALIEVLEGRSTGAASGAESRTASAQLGIAVATTLSRLGRDSPAVVRALIPVLGSENPRGRQAAEIVLEKIGPSAAAAVPAVIERLGHDADERVRRFAVAVLTAVGEEARAAVPALLRAARSDDSERVRQYSVEALPSVSAPAADAVPVLAEALGDEDWGVRASAARTLGGYGGTAKAAVPALRQAVQDAEKAVREAAQDALAAIRRGGSE